MCLGLLTVFNLRPGGVGVGGHFDHTNHSCSYLFIPEVRPFQKISAQGHHRSGHKVICLFVSWGLTRAPRVKPLSLHCAWTTCFGMRSERPLFREFREILQNWPFGKHKTRNFAQNYVKYRGILGACLWHVSPARWQDGGLHK